MTPPTMITARRLKYIHFAKMDCLCHHMTMPTQRVLRYASYSWLPGEWSTSFSSISRVTSFSRGMGVSPGVLLCAEHTPMAPNQSLPLAFCPGVLQASRRYRHARLQLLREQGNAELLEQPAEFVAARGNQATLRLDALAVAALQRCDLGCEFRVAARVQA